ncbi:MAG: hypothetical protein R3E79_10130 [Caldilineaceae bacterium]
MSSTEYKMPARCARCGVEQPTATGLIAKQADNRWVRFIWERREVAQFTVPVCESCKRTLDRHTQLVLFLGWGVAALLFLAIFFFLPDSIDWFIKLLIFIWAWAFGSRLVTWLYKNIVRHPQGVTWSDLCTYADGVLRPIQRIESPTL